MADKAKGKLAELRKQLTPKRIFLTLLIVIAVLLPTILAIVGMRYSDSPDAEATYRAQTVVLLDQSGRELFREDADPRENGESSLVSIFNSINNNLTQTDKISENVVTEAPITAKLIGDAQTKTLVCYFSFTEGSSYCTDEHGTYYRMLAEDSERFLASVFAESIYKESVLPTLLTSDGDTVIPTSVSWYYRNTDNKFLLSSLNETAAHAQTYHVTGGISLVFSDTPDRCFVEISNGAERVFTGDLNELSTLTLDYGTSFTVYVNAEWTQSDKSNCFGSASYSFNISVHNRSEFSLDKTELSAGEYAILRATHITDISRLSFSSDMGDFKPVFRLDGEIAYALIPCPTVANANGSYKITVSYGIATQTFTLSADRSQSKRQTELNRVADNLGLLNAARSDLNSSYIFLGGATSAPSDDYSIGSYFGDGSNCFTKYKRADGYGMAVRAVSGGRVARVGSSDILGTYVTVDMGLGLKVVYSHLSSADVRVGQYVAAGDVIGRTGALAYEGSHGFTLSLVYETTVLDSKYLFE